MALLKIKEIIYEYNRKSGTIFFLLKKVELMMDCIHLLYFLKI